MKINPYVKKFVDSFCSEDIIGLFAKYNNATKEITESMAMLNAAITYIPDVSNKLVIVIGDGRSPRTGRYFLISQKRK